MSKALALSILKLFGWKVKGILPPYDKYVLIGAPHTSNWDFVLMLLLSLYFKRKFYWMGKDTLFRPPFGFFFTNTGGIPVNRRVQNNAVRTVIDKFKTTGSMVLVITPEGTRKNVARWKSGFYHIAFGAGVPIVMGYADYKKKEIGTGPAFIPTGNIQADFKKIEVFYSTITGKFRENAGPVSPE